MNTSKGKDALDRARQFGDVRVSVQNKLYIYRLVKNTLGTGTQHKAPEIEEILKKDNILPQDLGFESLSELFDKLDDLFKLTTFKKGRYFVTLIQNDEYDEILARTDSTDSTEQKQAEKKPAKSWKQKKTAKELRPLKPRPNRRAREALDIMQVQTALADAYQELTEAFEPELSLPEDAEALREKALDELQEILAAIEKKRLLELSKLSAKELLETLSAKANDLHSELAADFLAELKEKQVQEEEPELEETELEPVQEVVEAEAKPEEELNETDEHEEVAEELEAVLAESSEKLPEAKVQAEDPVEDEVEEALEEQNPTIQLTITYDPAEGESEVAEQKPELVPVAPGFVSWAAPTGLAKDLPQSIQDEVLVPNELLNYLISISAFDADVLGQLDADLKHAINMLDLEGNRNRISFPLRFQKDGKTLHATLRRILDATSGKHWRLSYIDGATSDSEAESIDGLTTVYPKDIAPLLANTRRAADWSKESYLASFAKWGDLTKVLSDLAELAAPEDWGKDSAYAPLQEYLAETLSRLSKEDKILHNKEGFSALNTGLVSPFNQPIYACFETEDRWLSFLGFCTANDMPLAKRLTTELETLPKRANYFSAGYKLYLTEAIELSYDIDALLEKLSKLSANTAAEFSSLELTVELKGSYMYALESPTSIAYAYNPLDDKLLWLLPLEFQDRRYALVLEPKADGLRVQSVTSLQQARQFARTISKMLPQWLYQ